MAAFAVSGYCTETATDGGFISESPTYSSAEPEIEKPCRNRHERRRRAALIRKGVSPKMLDAVPLGQIDRPGKRVRKKP